MVPCLIHGHETHIARLQRTQVRMEIKAVSVMLAIGTKLAVTLGALLAHWRGKTCIQVLIAPQNKACLNPQTMTRSFVRGTLMINPNVAISQNTIHGVPQARLQ